jgi:Na+/serine symporter
MLLKANYIGILVWAIGLGGAAPQRHHAESGIDLANGVTASSRP